MLAYTKIDAKKVWEGLLLAFSGISTICLLRWVLQACHYGLDFSDEGFYLVWMSNPFAYDWSTTQFGFLYHPLYQLLCGDIAALRKANILTTFSLAWGLVNIFLRRPSSKNSSAPLSRFVVSAGFATVSMAFLNYWLPTPSYNSLALQGLLVTTIGLLLANQNVSPSSVSGWVIIGFGEWLAFMAKPSTAAVLAISAGFYLIFAKKLNVRLILASLGVALVLLVMSAIWIDGSLLKFVNRLKDGMEFYGALGGGHTLEQIIRVDDFQLNDREKALLCTTAMITFLSAGLLSSERRAMGLIGLSLSSIFFAIVVIITLGDMHLELGLGPSKGLLIWAIPVSVMPLVLKNYWLNRFVDFSQWALALTCFSLPYAYAFGTNGNYWYAAVAASLLWVLGGLALVTVQSSIENLNLLLPLALAAQAITAVVVYTGMESPYRQPQPLRLNNYSTEVGAPGANLFLAKEYGTYVDEAVASSRRAGFATGMPIIDLSGGSPSLLYALRAESVGQPWIIGGYPGSHRVASDTLKRVPCERLVNAWLLTEPDGPRRISTKVLATFGASLTDYEQVATWQTAEGASGFSQRRIQNLMKPVRNQGLAVKACRDALLPSKHVQNF